MTRRLTLPALLALTLFAGGCLPLPLIQEENAAQQDLIGDVAVQTKACENPFGGTVLIELLANVNHRAARGIGGGIGLDDAFRCLSREENLHLLESMPAMPHQVLLTYRVPAGAKAPESFTAKAEVASNIEQTRLRGSVRSALRALRERRGDLRGADDVRVGSHTITFSRDRAMDAEVLDFLEAAEPPAGMREPVADGEKLVSYRSDVVPGVVIDGLDLDARFGLPEGPSADEPYAGGFSHLALAGSRVAFDADVTGGPVDPDTLALVRPDRPVECMDFAGSGRADEEDRIRQAICPLPKDVFKDAFGVASLSDRGVAGQPDLFAGKTIETRDLRVVGGEAFAEQGQTAVVPFKLRTAGKAAGEDVLDVAATTTLAGATLTPSARRHFPATGDHPRSVSVQIPVDAAPGTYDVALTYEHGAVSRSGTGTVVVLARPADDPPAPVQQQQPSQQQQQSQQQPPEQQTPKPESRETVLLNADDTISMTMWCPYQGVSCGMQQFDALGPKAGIAPKATTAQAQKPRLLRIGRTKHRIASDKSSRVKIKLYPRAVRAIRRGRQVKGLVVVRAGGKGVPAVRRVVIKRGK